MAEEYGTFDPNQLPLPPGAPAADGKDEVLLPTFDPKYQDDFNGLAYIGALSETFEWLGHKICLRTLTTAEVLLVPLLTRKWEGTIGQQRAYYTAIVALSVLTVDGIGLPVPIGEDGSDAWAHQRFQHVQARWFDVTIDRFYSKYLELENRVREVVEEMEKASGQGANSTPGSNGSSGSSTAEGFSEG
jgi:hypothetical protein